VQIRHTHVHVSSSSHNLSLERVTCPRRHKRGTSNTYKVLQRTRHATLCG
jgi:hypothetical protein